MHGLARVVDLLRKSKAALKPAGFRVGDAEDFLQALSAEEEDLRALQEAVTELQAGAEGVPLDEAFASIRSRRGA